MLIFKLGKNMMLKLGG